jgi:FixJ family two-component response regulator
MISIIDDDRSIREAVRSLIRSLGYEAVAFSSAEEYLQSDRVAESECIITTCKCPA